MSLSRRYQSALEYMMTYGWAILVIVIVAAVLYSLWIFSPSSSLSTTVIGFANTPVSSAAFTNNGGLAFSVGDLVGYPIEITNVTEITASGSKITILPNITVSPSQTKVIIIPKAFSSSTQGSHESVSLTITYTEPGQVFQGPYTSTGTVSGTTPTLFFPTNQTFAAVSKLTITNSQTTATSSPFQQMINVTSTSPGWAYISQDFGQNVEFFYPNGTVIPSWLESYTSSGAIWWLKISAIPASSSITVYMGVTSTSTNLFNTVNDGEAPQIPCGSTPTSSCSNYAEYDDGANVFNNYWNFAGTDLPSGWTTQVTIGSITINNGVIIRGGTYSAFNTVGVYLNTTYLPNLPYIVDFASQMPTSPADVSWTSNWYGFTNSTTTYATAPNTKNFLFQFSSGTNAADSSTFGGSYTSGDLNAPPNNVFNGVFTLYVSSISLFGYYNYTQFFGSITGASYNQARIYFLIAQMGQEGNYVPSQQIYWIRTRAYPPDGVMPSVSFGSVS